VTCGRVRRRTVTKTQEWRFGGKIITLRENFRNSSIKVRWSTPIDVFAGISYRSVSLQRNATSLYSLQKTSFSPPFCAPWPRAPKLQHVRFEFALHMPVKFYPNSLRFAWVIPENPIHSDYIVCCMHACMYMTAYNNSNVPETAATDNVESSLSLATVDSRCSQVNRVMW